MSIKTRMFIGILGAVFFLFVSNMIAQYIFHSTTETSRQITQVNYHKVDLLNKLKNLSDQRAVLFRDLVIYEKPDILKHSREALKETAKRISGIFKQLDKMSLNKQEKAFYQQIKDNVGSANRSFGNFITALDAGFPEDARDILIEEFNPKFKAFSKIVLDFKSYEEASNVKLVSKLNAQEIFGADALWGVLALSILIFSVVGIFVAKSFLRPIRAINEIMCKIVKTGDLSHRAPVYTKDEIGQSAQAINELLSTIHSAINDVNSTMTEISNGSFKQKIEASYEGDFSTLKNGVNQTYDQIFNMVVMLRGTASNLKNGVFEPIHNEYANMKGDYQAVMVDVSSAMNDIRLTVENISSTLSSLALGDFSKRVDVQVTGEFINLKHSINQTIDSLDQFVGEVVSVQTKISDGDLTDFVKQNYHGKMAALKDSLNFSTQNMAGMIAKVGAVTKLVSDEASTIARSSQSVSESIHEQTIALEGTSSQMEQMTSTVQQNADAASNANQMTQQAQEKLKSGVAIMDNALASMDQMTDASNKINDIISIIDSIAFQTNLLALNAAVEAARAGEHGRGFAVVASEVRSLAGKSADAAAEIKKLIENSAQISDESGRYVRQTSDALSEVNEAMQEISGMISEIASASQEQASGISTVNQAVVGMESSTQQNASLVEESASGSRDLFEQSGQLLALVQGFKVDEQMVQRIAKHQHSELAQQFEKMIEAHRAWKGRIRGFVDGMDIGITYEVATDHTACILGKWYYGEGQKLMHLPLMKQLGDEHMEMHQAIKKVMDAKEVDDAQLVAEGMDLIDRQSEKVVSLLQQLEDQVV